MIIEKIQIAPIGSYLKLKTEDIEVQRLKVTKNSVVEGKALNQLNKFNNASIIIGAIIHDNQVTIPWGETIINENDDRINELEKEIAAMKSCQ